MDAIVAVDEGYDANWIGELIERCCNKLKQFRHIAMRLDRNPLCYLAMIKFASTRLMGLMSPQTNAVGHYRESIRSWRSSAGGSRVERS